MFITTQGTGKVFVLNLILTVVGCSSLEIVMECIELAGKLGLKY